jgi:hypothetical protein
MEGRLPGARGPWSPTGGWKPPLRQTTVGSVNAEILPSTAVTSDIYPTLLEIAGVKVDHQPVLDGTSLWPLLEPGTPERIWRHLSCWEN